MHDDSLRATGIMLRYSRVTVVPHGSSGALLSREALR